MTTYKTAASGFHGNLVSIL